MHLFNGKQKVFSYYELTLKERLTKDQSLCRVCSKWKLLNWARSTVCFGQYYPTTLQRSGSGKISKALLLTTHCHSLTCQNVWDYYTFVIITCNCLIYKSVTPSIPTTFFDLRDIKMGVIPCCEGLLHEICSSFTPTSTLLSFLHSVFLTHCWDSDKLTAKAACIREFITSTLRLQSLSIFTFY